MSKPLVIYYSMQGHTKKVAKLIADKTGSDLLQIKPKRDYNFASALTLGKRHIKNGHMPPIQPLDFDVDAYEHIILGTPVWWYTFVPHVRTFMNENDLSGKSIILFSTHGGANGSTFSDMKKAIGPANFLGEKDFYTPFACKWNSIEADVAEWLKSGLKL